MADHDWCKWAARFGWSIEEAADKLLEVSEKAQERRSLGDPGYRPYYCKERRGCSCDARPPAGQGLDQPAH
jgi:hypothetical protein